MEYIYNFFLGTEWYVYAAIFFAKILEIAFSTVRIILVNKGYRTTAFFAGTIEIFIWLFVASSVLTGLHDDPFKAVPYGLGFAFGLVAGSRIEQWLAFGYVVVQVICDVETSPAITSCIRAKKIGVTEIEAKGFKGDKKFLTMFVNRKNSDTLAEELRCIDEKAMFIINDVGIIKGGTFPKRRFFYIEK